MFTPENYGRNHDPSNAGGNGAQPFEDRSRGDCWRISSGRASEPQRFVGAFDLIERPSRIDLFRMASGHCLHNLLKGLSGFG
jgi:hypothetical protein